jgi:hypothetical protein
MQHGKYFKDPNKCRIAIDFETSIVMVTALRNGGGELNLGLIKT